MSGENSLERALAILGLFDERHLEWTSEAMMARLGYSRPTLYRYLKRLKEAGLLTSASNASYTLGPKVVELDYLLSRGDRLVLEGERHVAGLAARHPGTAYLSRWYGDKVLCVCSVSSCDEVASSYPRGRPMPVGPGSTSRAILAFLPAGQRRRIIEGRMAVFREIGFGTNEEEIQARLKRIRQAGHAIAHGEVTPGVVGISAPVFAAGPTPIASLTLTVAEHRATAPAVETMAADVRTTAADIGARLARRRVGRRQAHNGTLHDDATSPG